MAIKTPTMAIKTPVIQLSGTELATLMEELHPPEQDIKREARRQGERGRFKIYSKKISNVCFHESR